MILRTVPNPSHSDRRRGPLAYLVDLVRDVVRVARDVPGQILLGIDARAELLRARQTMHAAGWADFGRSHADDVAELAEAWAAAQRDRAAMRDALVDVTVVGDQAAVDRVARYLDGNRS